MTAPLTAAGCPTRGCWCRGRRFMCPKCKRLVPLCFGGAPAKECDDCWTEDREALAVAIERFRVRHPECARPIVVAGLCFQFCVEFQEHLFELGLITEAGREKIWDVEKVTHVDGRPVGHLVNQHWVFRFRDTYVDWTARQFWADAAVPVVWKRKA